MVVCGSAWTSVSSTQLPSRMLTLYPGLMTSWMLSMGLNGSLLWTLRVDIGRCLYRSRTRRRPRFGTSSGQLFEFNHIERRVLEFGILSGGTVDWVWIKARSIVRRVRVFSHRSDIYVYVVVLLCCILFPLDLYLFMFITEFYNKMPLKCFPCFPHSSN